MHFGRHQGALDRKLLVNDHIPKSPAGQDDLMLRLPLPWLQSRCMRGSAFTMASLVTWCMNGDNTFNPRIWQIASRSGLSTRQTKDHIRLLANQDWILRSRKIRRAPTATTISPRYLDWIRSDRTKYLELRVDDARRLGCEHANVSLLARCVAASISNEKQLQQRIRDQNNNGDLLTFCDPRAPQRIARELKTQRRYVEQAISDLESCGAAPAGFTLPGCTPQGGTNDADLDAE